MKTLSTQFLANANSLNGASYMARLRLFQSRTYITTLNTDDIHPMAQVAKIRYPKEGDFVLPQACSYDDINNHPINLVLDTDGNLDAIIPGGSTTTIETGLAYQRPGLLRNQVAYVNNSNQMMFGAIGGTLQSIDNSAKIGAAHLFLGGVATFYYDDGGISIRLALETQQGWQYKTSPHRFIDPGAVWPTGQFGIARINFSAVTRKGNRVFFYLTMPSGKVEGLSYDIDTSLWGDYFDAVPADLTGFYLSGSYTDIMGRIHLVGQFVRTQEQDSGLIYNLDCFSDTGEVFALDRFTLFSTLGLRLLPAFDPSGEDLIYYIDAGRWAQGARLWTIYGGTEQGNTPMLEIDKKWIVSLSGQPGNSYSLQITDGPGSYWRDERIVDGIPVELDISPDRGASWERLDTCVISRRRIEPIRHRLSLELTNESVWRVSDLSYPMYVEMQSKQAIKLGQSELDQLSKAGDSTGVPEIFCLRFPNSSGQMGGSESPIPHLNDIDKEIWSEDLIGQNSLTEYPRLPAPPFYVDIFGWSRTGIDDTNPNTPDSTPSARPNDDFQPMFLIKRNGSEQTITIPKTAALNDICYPPETYDPTNARSPAGTVPVRYEVIDGLGLLEDDEVVKVGVLVSAPNKAFTPKYSTVFWIERMEIPNMVQYVSESTSETDWEQEETKSLIGMSTNGDLYDYVNHSKVDYSDHIWLTSGNKFVVDSTGMTQPSWIIGGAMFRLEASGIPAGTPGRLRVTAEFEFLKIPANPGAYFELEAYIEDSGQYGFAPSLIAANDWQYINEYSFGPETFQVGYKRTITSDLSSAPTAFSSPGYVAIAVESQVDIWGTEGDLHYEYWSYSFTITKLEWIDANGAVVGNVWQQGDPSSLGQGGESLKINYKYKVKGKPSVLFAERPNYAFDFDIRAKYNISGKDSWAGLVGLASDAKNLYGIRVDTTRIQFFRLRGGKVYVLDSMTTNPISSFAIDFKHRHGDFYVYIRTLDASQFPEGPRMLTATMSYRWKASDGPLLSDPLTMHVGVYTFIDAPTFRICGFNLADSDGIGVLPGTYELDGSNPLSRFPESGTVEIGGIKYTYTGKTPIAKTPRGPFCLRNSGNWDWHTNPLDGQSYGNQNMCEFTYFDWTESRSAWNDYFMASSNGGNWLITDLEHRAFITTGGDVVRLRNRCRGYGPTCNNDDSVSISDRLSLTYGLIGIGAKEGDPQLHVEGSNCFLDQVNEIKLLEFFGVSGGVDTTVRDLLAKICQMAGARAVFLGDKDYSGTLSNGEARKLYGV